MRDLCARIHLLCAENGMIYGQLAAYKSLMDWLLGRVCVSAVCMSAGGADVKHCAQEVAPTGRLHAGDDRAQGASYQGAPHVAAACHA